MLAQFIWIGLLSSLLVWPLFPAVARADEFVNSLGMEFVLIPAGIFTMGEWEDEASNPDELPRHEVEITTPFYLGKFEVTQDQWMSVMGANPSEFRGQDHPVDNVSWNDAQNFLRRLNQKENTDRYRLPSEAEWEYSVRAGSDSIFFFGGERSSLGKFAWFVANADEKTHPVGLKNPNPWGLFDVYGNVWEWVNDWFSEDYYADSPLKDPLGPSETGHKSMRGGSIEFEAGVCRSANRINFSTKSKDSDFGFRVAFTASKEDFKSRRFRFGR
ncbi:MAG: formylglycine-generating enzyme family protein [Deltaproteobacteria bacterium]|jgi:formylglycine-generating enzyme required for sulfatase activity|nr:formylglycine-generating enzyme family protein [Deltaproteobacteria bacterium]